MPSAFRVKKRLATDARIAHDPTSRPHPTSTRRYIGKPRAIGERSETRADQVCAPYLREGASSSSWSR